MNAQINQLNREIKFGETKIEELERRRLNSAAQSSVIRADIESKRAMVRLLESRMTLEKWRAERNRRYPVIEAAKPKLAGGSMDVLGDWQVEGRARVTTD